MKTSSHAPVLRSAFGKGGSRITHHPQRGMAVIIVLAFLAIILIYLAGNARTLHWLARDLKVVEQKQVHRLAGTTLKTNFTEILPGQGAPTDASK